MTQLDEPTTQPAPPPPATRPIVHRTATVLTVLGRTLMACGALLLLFVVYQLWGTGLQEARSQDKAQDTFTERLEQVDALDPAVLDALRNPSSSTPPTTIAPLPTELVNLLTPQEGEPVAFIRIPKIGLEKVVVQGVSVEDLQKGPGHYDESPLPGQAGNAAIAGHRTTYGAPFNQIDQLAPGDQITVTTVLGTATYTVSAEPYVVSPDQVEVLDDFGDNRLTLTSCHPKYSAAQRLVVNATLVGQPFGALPSEPTSVQVPTVVTTPDGLPATTTAAAPSTTEGSTSTEVTTTPAAAGDEDPSTIGGDESSLDLDQGLAGDSSAWPAAAAWAALTALVCALAWFIARRWSRTAERRPWIRKGVVYLAASPVFFVVLYFCFENVDRLLPAY